MECDCDECGAYSKVVAVDRTRLCVVCMEKRLAAAEKMVSEAEASNAVMKTALEKTKMGFEAFWLNYKRQHYPDHQSDCQCKGCSDCRAVLAEADIALQNLPARAQAVAEVLEKLKDFTGRQPIISRSGQDDRLKMILKEGDFASWIKLGSAIDKLDALADEKETTT